MNVTLSREQEALIRQAIDSGRFERVEDAVAAALRLWESYERRRGELLASLDEAEASLDRGEGIALTGETSEHFIEDVIRHGRVELDAEKRRLT